MIKFNNYVFIWCFCVSQNIFSAPSTYCDVYNSKLCQLVESANGEFFDISNIDSDELETICVQPSFEYMPGKYRRAKCKSLKQIDESDPHIQVKKSFCEVANGINQNREFDFSKYYEVYGNQDPTEAEIIFIGENHKKSAHPFRTLIALNNALLTSNSILLVEGVSGNWPGDIFSHYFTQFHAAKHLYENLETKYVPEELLEARISADSAQTMFRKYDLTGHSHEHFYYFGCSKNNDRSFEHVLQSVMFNKTPMYGWDYPDVLDLNTLDVSKFRRHLVSKNFSPYSREGLIAALVNQSKFLSKKVDSDIVLQLAGVSKIDSDYKFAVELIKTTNQFIKYKMKTITGPVKASEVLVKDVTKAWKDTVKLTIKRGIFLRRFSLALRNLKMIYAAEKFRRKGKRVIINGGSAHSPLSKQVGEDLTEVNADECGTNFLDLRGNDNICRYFTGENYSVLIPKDID